MVTPKKSADKGKASAPRSVVAPSIQPAAVVVPAVSVVGNVSVQEAKDHAVVLKKQNLVDRIVTASGAKKKDVKLIFEAALAVLGDALSAGEELNLPPLGKLKVNRQKAEGNAEVIIIKLRRSGGNAAVSGAKEGLAADGEDD